jgi:acetyl esterase/lipase
MVIRNATKILIGSLCVLFSIQPPALSQLSDLDIKPDVVYGHKDGMALTFDVFRPKENANGIGLLFMVSGGWVSLWAPPQQTVGLIRPLLDKGYTVFCVRHGSSPRYVIPEIAEDIRSALGFIAEHAEDHQVDPNRLGVFGFSAGGHLSLLLGTIGGKPANKLGKGNSRVAAVVAVFPPTDLNPYVDPKNPLREQFPALKFPPEKADDFSPLKHVTSEDAPTLLVHGDKDELVPIWHSEKIHEAFDSAKVANRLVVIKGAAHGFNAEGNKTMTDNMIQWFDEHLKNDSPKTDSETK